MRKRKKAGRNYIRICVLGLDEVLGAISDPGTDKAGHGVKHKATFNGHTVNVASLRLRTFRDKGTVCMACGLQASFFAIEACSSTPEQVHLNLYGMTPDGTEILFTKDHVHPKSKGGKDHISNMQTMCTQCNGKKADRLLTSSPLVS